MSYFTGYRNLVVPLWATCTGRSDFVTWHKYGCICATLLTTGGLCTWGVGGCIRATCYRCICATRVNCGQPSVPPLVFSLRSFLSWGAGLSSIRSYPAVLLELWVVCIPFAGATIADILLLSTGVLKTSLPLLLLSTTCIVVLLVKSISLLQTFILPPLLSRSSGLIVSLLLLIFFVWVIGVGGAFPGVGGAPHVGVCTFK